jgi:hypothetical protein
MEMNWSPRSERHIDDLNMSPLRGSDYLGTVYPQLALWAMDISLASPTEAVSMELDFFLR